MFLIPEDSYEIRTTPHKGRGAFATRDIEAGTIIGDYIGQVYRGDEYTNPTKDIYDMQLVEGYVVAASADSGGVHLLNHSCTPNCGTEGYQGHVLFFAIRRIFAGEELTISYFLDPPNSVDCMPCHHGCACDSPFCHGTWHLPQSLTDRINAEYEDDDPQYVKSIASQVGHELAQLDTYPESMPDDEFYDLLAARGVKPAVSQAARIPPRTEVRRMIREGGRPIHFKKLGLVVSGVVRDHVIIDPDAHE